MMRLLASISYPRTANEKAKGEYRINCLYCGFTQKTPDKKGKLYINPKKGSAHCFRCGYKTRNLVKLFKTLFGDNFDVNEYAEVLKPTPKVLDTELSEIALPRYTRSVLTESGVREIDSIGVRALEYLFNRGLTIEQVEHHDFHFCYAGLYQERIIIPVVVHGKNIGWTARTLLSKAEYKRRYKDALYRPYLFPLDFKYNSAFYNQDSVCNTREIIVVEGVFDLFSVERALPGCQVVASFTKNLSAGQRNILKMFERVVICWDKDALATTVKTAKELPNADVMLVDAKDPGEASESLIREAYATIGNPRSVNLVYALIH